ncbi:MAG: chemotaxis-specific protein-glutamate methyltransferase CheB [Pseudomonadota bacterium]
MSSPAKRILIVDDSRVMRSWLRSVLSADPRLQVVGEAGNAIEARDFLKAQQADVLTLDIEMPGMSGLDFLTRLMRARPMPVVMMSSLTMAGSDAAVQALSRGAIDCMVKPSDGYDPTIASDICERVYHASCTRATTLMSRVAQAPVAQPVVADPAKPPIPRVPCRQGAIILIGASTGGVAALETVLPDLDPGGPPVVIVQHMPGNFLVSFAERLNRQLPQNVTLAQNGMVLSRGDVVLAPGEGQHTEVRRRDGEWSCRFTANEPPALHCPAVDKLFKSAVSQAKFVTAVLLTGLGRDGAEGLHELHQASAMSIGQDEHSCVVYGMPRAAKALGAVELELPLDRIGQAVRSGRSRAAKHAPRTADIPGP